jgi:hypothetical protein
MAGKKAQKIIVDTPKFPATVEKISRQTFCRHAYICNVINGLQCFVDLLADKP